MKTIIDQPNLMDINTSILAFGNGSDKLGSNKPSPNRDSARDLTNLALGSDPGILSEKQMFDDKPSPFKPSSHKFDSSPPAYGTGET